MNKQLIEKAFEKAVWYITKYKNDEDYKAGKFYERVKFEENALVNEGINHILTILATDAKTGTPYGNAQAYLIVGAGSGAADPTDVYATFSTPVGVGMEAGYPTYGTSQKVTWKSSFGSGVANQAWAEFGVTTSTPISGGKLLNRKVSDQGTKTSGQTWELELAITFS